MSDAVFVDTNVLVYARDQSEKRKQQRALEWMIALWDSRRGRISMQVLQEYYVTVTEKLDPPRNRDEAREDVLALYAWKPATADVALLERSWILQDKFGFSWWDSQIVAAALTARCRFLLTEDLQDEQSIDDLTIVNPFTHEPDKLLATS